MRATPILLIIALTGCGEKIPLPSNIVDDPLGRLQDTVYVNVLPPWTGADGVPFNKPKGIAAGYDRSIYVCDTDNDRIARLDAQGRMIEVFSVPHPTGVSQDRGLDLVCINGTPTVRVRRFRSQGDFTPLFVMDSVRFCRPNRGDSICFNLVPRPLSVAASPEVDKKFFLAEEWSGQVWRFDIHSPVPLPSFATGSSPGLVFGPTGVATAVGPDPAEGYRVIVVQYPSINGLQYIDWPSRRAVIPDPSADIYERTRTDTKSVAVDRLANVFVLHQKNALVMMFSRRGEYVLSFGRPGTDSLGMMNPSGIAVLDDIVLVADTDNNRIVRYQMTAVPN